jgi:uncharacterized membrane protein YkoI
MKSTYRSLLILASALLLGAPISREAAAEQDIPLAQVPENVRVAAEKAVPGITFTEADILRSRKGHIYELEGTAGDSAYEIKVSPGGKVLKVEKEDRRRR